jgi:hypothetical protein
MFYIFQSRLCSVSADPPSPRRSEIFRFRWRRTDGSCRRFPNIRFRSNRCSKISRRVSRRGANHIKTIFSVAVADVVAVAKKLECFVTELIIPIAVTSVSDACVLALD